MAHEVASGPHWLLVVQGLVWLWLWLMMGVVASMPVLLRLTEGGRVSTDMAIVIIVARGSFSTMPSVGRIHTAILILGRPPDKYRVIGMRLDVLLQVLGALEGLATEVALVRLQRNMDANMRRDVVALDSCGAARVPLAGQIQVVGALSAHMSLADMIVESLGRIEALVALIPTANEAVILTSAG